ncbi:MAG TPA: terminase small subunit [Gammaproteobacteria bacterium]|nr:terminase small subunit [Gammaproteobacteria bacterium]
MADLQQRITTLSEQKQQFCREFLIDLNAVAAGSRAGIAKGGSGALMTDPLIQAEITRLQDERAIRTQVTADRVLQEIARVAFARVPDVVNVEADSVSVTDFKDIDEDAKAAIASVRESLLGDNKGSEIEVKFHDKLKALELAARHLNMFQAENLAKGNSVNMQIRLRPDQGDAVEVVSEQ